MRRTPSANLEQLILDEFSKPLPRSITQMALDLGYQDNTALLYHIRKLVKAGLLIRPKKGTYKTVLIDNTANANIIQIPYYGEAKCGPDGNMLEDYPEYTIPLNIQVLRRNSKDLFALKAVGDSMNPTIQAGDTVIAEKYKNSDIGTKEFFIVAHENKILIKKISKQKSNDGFLMSINPDYMPISINKEEFRIVGRVVSVFKNLA